MQPVRLEVLLAAPYIDLLWYWSSGLIGAMLQCEFEQEVPATLRVIQIHAGGLHVLENCWHKNIGWKG